MFECETALSELAGNYMLVIRLVVTGRRKVDMYVKSGCDLATPPPPTKTDVPQTETVSVEIVREKIPQSFKMCKINTYLSRNVGKRTF